MSGAGVVRVGWVVDVQNDFMDPEGRLYVRHLGDDTDPGAVLVEPAIRAAVAWMREHCAVTVFTGDWHGVDDPEIDPVAPDPAAGTYPPHCMGRSADVVEREGAEIIASVRPESPIVLERHASFADARRTAEQAIAEHRPVFIHKGRFDVFEGNAATEPFVDALVEGLGGDVEFVVVGVARDVCVTQAVDGLQARGRSVVAVRDATWGLGLEPEEVTLARWAACGRVVTLDELRPPATPRSE